MSRLKSGQRVVYVGDDKDIVELIEKRGPAVVIGGPFYSLGLYDHTTIMMVPSSALQKERE